MQTTLRKAGELRTAKADLVVVFVPSGDGPLDGPAAAADAALDGLVTASRADGEITGEAGSLTVLHTGGRMAAPRVAVVGIGDGGVDRWRAAGRAAGNRARELRARTVAIAPGDAGADRVAAAVVGVEAGAYRFTRYRTEDVAKRPPVRALQVLGGGATAAQVRRAANTGTAVSGARVLADTPSNDMTPTALAERAEAIAAGIPGLSARILGPRELTRLKAGALLGVARGSAEPPRMIVLRWTPPKRRRAAADQVLGLVGKAVTFDTGGISIKPSQGMEEMKLDMSGGAAVVEAMGLIAQQGVPLEVVGVVPATENMPSGTATKPGDVVTAMNGKTIEVINTDAEGRLILADALCYATAKAGATRLIDFATLTGAIVVALGEVYAGLFGSDAEWTDAVRAAGEASGDLCWPMPLHEGYANLISSRVADLSNSANKRQAGAVYAAQFLREFTDGRPWCHVDIAGTGMIGGAGTGFGVGLMLHAAEALAGS
ncbi:MAG: leucyl aminopeptidase [Thermoleophilia bacterium]|nr:leucyl aminopeptidase [Thermoleophilia bacterium]